MKLRGKMLILTGSIIIALCGIIEIFTGVMLVLGKAPSQIFTLVIKETAGDIPLFLTILTLVYGLILIFTSLFGIRHNGHVDASKGTIMRALVASIATLPMYLLYYFEGILDISNIGVILFTPLIVIGSILNMSDRNK